MKKYLLTLIIIFPWTISFAQVPVQKENRSVSAKQTNATIVVDGDLNETAWKEAAVAGDYTGYLSPTLPVIVCPGDSGNGLTPRTGNHLTQGYR